MPDPICPSAPGAFIVVRVASCLAPCKSIYTQICSVHVCLLPTKRNKLLSSTIASLRLPESARKERACLLPRLSSSLTTPSQPKVTYLILNQLILCQMKWINITIISGSLYLMQLKETYLKVQTILVNLRANGGTRTVLRARKTVAACRRYKSNQTGINLLKQKEMNAVFNKTI